MTPEKIKPSRNMVEALAEFLASADDRLRSKIAADLCEGEAQEMFKSLQQESLETLVYALTGHEHWEFLKSVRLCDAMNGVRRVRTELRNNGSDAMEEVYRFIAKNPGRTSGRIQAGLRGQIDSVSVKKALAKLKRLRRLIQTGQRRAATYAAV
jgi:hypothetical protein